MCALTDGLLLLQFIMNYVYQTAYTANTISQQSSILDYRWCCTKLRTVVVLLYTLRLLVAMHNTHA
jgi:uncharacterized protein YebE (UPF0316 family)